MSFVCRSYIDDSIHFDINIYKDVDGNFNVVLNCKDMTEDQAYRLFDFIVRPFFTDRLNLHGAMPSSLHLNKDLDQL